MTNQPYSYQQSARSNMLPAPALPPPRPEFFLSRSNTGLLVPLIPADELPFNISLQGVPRVMRAEDTVGMQCVSYIPYVGTTYKLDRGIYLPALPHEIDSTNGMVGQTRAHCGGAPVQPKFLAPDHFARQALAQVGVQAQQGTINAGITMRPLSAHETATNWRSSFNPTPATANQSPQQIPATASTISSSASAQLANNKTTSKTQELINAILSTTTGACTAANLNYTAPSGPLPGPSGTAPDSEKKQYCTYWIRTGCLFKHEMPDRETLESIGFRNVPRWWAEKNAGVGGMRSSVMMKSKTILGQVPNDARAMIGKPRDVSEWLKKSSSDCGEDRSATSDGEGGNAIPGSEADDEGSGAEQKVGEKEVRTPQQSQSPLTEPLVPETVKHLDSKQEPTATSPKQPEVVEAKATTSRSPPAIDIRKASTCSDLIDLAYPTSPNPSSSPPPDTPALTPTTSAASTRPSTPLTPRAASFNPVTPEKAEKKQIFVPKGESILPHIQDVRKHQLRQRIPRAPISEQTRAMPLEKQIQERQRQQSRAQALVRSKTSAQALITVLPKPQTCTTESEGKAVITVKLEKGLSASQHAPKTLAQSGESRGQQSGAGTEQKSSRKSAPRGARRPARK
ncbi:hypothetical protein LTR78_001406 [Recurvomyces mirabilis]|uniref:Uncharacterized protein n=1 Tax=Recurvomyces mirabilis TaxID=574656 RepID=A0AAE0WVJ4_9PEZI|nr:hypothetical protein LTR78_001406 [Recurvomyces mirabilis]KAK5161383.1 hypothetical protein LTS14_001179 [Recurvomyces mirabilis]